MRSRTSVLLGALMFAAALMLMATAATAGKLPEGMSVKVLAEFPSEIPGIEKVVLKEMRLEPGAKRENYVVGATVLCTVIQGELTGVWGGKTVFYGPGSRFTVPKGTKIQGIYNNGRELHVQRIWKLVHSK